MIPKLGRKSFFLPRRKSDSDDHEDPQETDWDRCERSRPFSERIKLARKGACKCLSWTWKLRDWSLLSID